MPELRDLLQAEADRLQPRHLPPFNGVVTRSGRRRRRTTGLGLAVVLLAGAAAVPLVRAAVSGDGPPDVLVPGGGALPAPDVLVVECTADGVVLPQGSRVAAQRDGVHYLFRNTTQSDVGITYELAGDQVAAGQVKTATSTRVAPGQATSVSCGSDGDVQRANARPVQVVDPDRVHVPVPACTGGTVIRDFVQPMRGDPLALTRRDHARAEPVGYPDGSPRLVFTGDTLISWEGGGDAWTPSQTTTCTGATPASVAGGLRAPPPVHLARTDEFGVITSLSAGEVVVDRVDMLSGDEAQAAAGGGDVSNDYVLRNDSAQTRSYRLSPDVAVWGGIRFGQPPDQAVPVGLDRLRELLTTPEGRSTLFHLQVDDGVVVAIEEQYRP